MHKLRITNPETREQCSADVLARIVEQVDMDLQEIANPTGAMSRVVDDAVALHEDMPEPCRLIPLGCARIGDLLCELGARVEVLAGRVQEGGAQ